MNALFLKNIKFV